MFLESFLLNSLGLGLRNRRIFLNQINIISMYREVKENCLYQIQYGLCWQVAEITVSVMLLYH